MKLPHDIYKGVCPMYSLPHLLKFVMPDLQEILNDSMTRILASGNYYDLTTNLDRALKESARKILPTVFERMDAQFKASERRKALYYTKGKRERTLMTPFGEIRFKREYYVPKSGTHEEGFFYVDQTLKLPRRDYYDPLIKARLIEESAKGSYKKAGETVGASIGPWLKSRKARKRSAIARQTVRNILLNTDIEEPEDPRTFDATTLHIQMDEKHVHTQREGGRSQEIKGAVVHTGPVPVSKKRNALKDRTVLTTTGTTFSLKTKLMDYISKHFNERTLKQIVVSGDGASWIKLASRDLRFADAIETSFTLDRFHLSQAIQHITKHPGTQSTLRDLIKGNFKRSFREATDYLIRITPERQDTITAKRDYILNHWHAIQNQKHPRFKGCSMEGHISHVYASLFTSRPKAYSKRMIDKLSELRTMDVNDVDIAQSYLEQYTDYFLPQKAELTLPNDQPRHASIESSAHWHRDLMKNINHSGFRKTEPS